MVLATLVLMAAAAASDGDLISGKMIAALFAAIFAGGGGIWIGRKGGESAAEKSWAEREQKIRAEITNELRTKIVNDPLHVELCKDYVSRSEFQTFVEGNEKEHNNIFLRLTANDHQMGEVKGLLTGIREDLTLIKSKIFRK